MSQCRPKCVDPKALQRLQCLRRLNSLVAAQSRGSKWKHALLLSESAVEPDFMLLNSRLSALEKGSAWRAAVDSLAIIRQGVRPAVFGVNSVLSAFANAAGWHRALGLMAKFRDSADQVSCNAVLTGLSRSSRWRRALTTERWQAHALDSFSVDGLLRCNNVVAAACGKGGRWERTASMLAALGSQVLRIDAVSLRSALNAFERGMSWSRAIGVVSDSILTVGVAGVNSAISACRNAQAWVESVQLLGSLWQTAMRPTLVSWAAVVAACHGVWEACCNVFRQGGHPSAVSIGAASEACAAGGAWAQSLDLLGEAQLFSLELDAMTWNGLLSACQQQVLWSQSLCVLAELAERSGPLPGPSLSPVALEATVSALAQTAQGDGPSGSTGAGGARRALPRALFLARAVGLAWLRPGFSRLCTCKCLRASMRTGLPWRRTLFSRLCTDRMDRRDPTVP